MEKDNPDLAERLKGRVMVTGGSIVSMLLNEEVNDYDIYFTDWQTTRDVALYYVDKFKARVQNGITCRLEVTDGYGNTLTPTSERKMLGSDVVGNDPVATTYDTISAGIKMDRVKIMVKSAGIASVEGTTKEYEYFEGAPKTNAAEYLEAVIDGTSPTSLDDAEDLIEKAKSDVRGLKDVKARGNHSKYEAKFLTSNAITLTDDVQLIIRFFGEPTEIHSNYDFIHCTNYWTFKDGLVLNKDALASILAKEMKYVGSKYPLCSILRTRKFIKRGWTINAGQMLKIILQLQQLNLLDPKVLQDQLLGVDAAYFSQLIAAVNDKDPDTIDYAYIVELIEKIEGTQTDHDDD